jgi:hypothetical protein
VLGIQQSGSDRRNPEARAGVMIRAFDENPKLPTVPYAAMVFSSVLGALFQRRLADKAAPIQDGPLDTFYPNWLRLSCESTERTGFLRFKGELSADGVNWQQLGALAEIEISGRVMVGLVVTTQSGRSNTASQENALATFSDVVVTPIAE